MREKNLHVREKPDKFRNLKKNFGNFSYLFAILLRTIYNTLQYSKVL